MKKYLLPIYILTGFSVVIMAWTSMLPEDKIEIAGEPTNFVQKGTMVFNNPGLASGMPYLIYEEPGKPAITKELVLDELSFCVAQNGSEPCLALNVTLDMPFNGKKVVVEGILKDNKVLVRKMARIAEGLPFLASEAGRVFISWEAARKIIEKCLVKMIMQTHSLDITLTLRDGRRVVTISPKIDDVFLIAQKANCKDVVIATE